MKEQGNSVRNVVMLVGGAFAALFVAMVVVMAVREAPRQTWTYSMTTSFSPASGTVAFYRSGAGAPQVLGEAPTRLLRRSGLLPVRFADDPVVFSEAPLIVGKAPIIYQTKGAMPLYVPADKVILENADPEEKKE